MTRKKAKAAARFIEEYLIKPREPLVFVEVLEVNGYLPKVFINQRITRCHIRKYSTSHDDFVILCELVSNIELAYLLNNPEINDITSTLHFRDKNPGGQEILRSFTLMRSYRDEEERLLWLGWRHNLI